MNDCNTWYVWLVSYLSLTIVHLISVEQLNFKSLGEGQGTLLFNKC